MAAWCNISFHQYSHPLSGGNDLYLNGELVTELVIPDGVTDIGDYAFAGSGITSVTIPDSVTNIGNSAFSWCRNLTSVTIPDSLTNIENSAFEFCNNLTSVYITDMEAWCNISFASYDANPLYNAKGLYLNGELITELVIPDSITDIGDYAFGGG